MAIFISTKQTSQSLIGKSHWWGAPDLPEHVPYPCVTVVEDGEEIPEPLTFVCQIRCRDLVETDTENLLPHTGMLYFFAPIDYFLGETDSPLDYHDTPIIIYSPEEENLHPYQMCWENTDESVFRPAETISFQHSKSDCDDGIIMLGQPYQEEITTAHPNSISLLQLDENEQWGMRFFDMGMYYFLIGKEDLKAQRWDRVIGDLYTY